MGAVARFLPEWGLPLTDRPPNEPPPYWTQSAPAARWRDRNALHRFLGGAPLAVAVKLAVISMVVGALLMWLHISPADVLAGLADLLQQLYALGFRSLRDFGTYLAAGAAIVLPVWFVIRLLSFPRR